MQFQILSWASDNMISKAVVLAAGSGKRMNSTVKKQYMELCGRPLIFYALNTFESSFIDEIVMVVSEGDEEYCRQEIVEKYGFKKVKKIVAGGKERYHSVYEGIKACGECDYIFIHDGARAFVDDDTLRRCLDAVVESKACVAAVKAKDTIKLENGQGFVKETLNRNLLWTVQTPQVFEYALIKKCYEELLQKESLLMAEGVAITDDTMAVETFSDVKVRLVEGSYNNIKITTPEDIILGEAILAKYKADKMEV